MSDDLIEIVPYDPAWPGLFGQERDALLAALGDGMPAPAVEHVGSTAVPGLAAKPTIDLMVGVEELLIDEGMAAILAGLGYRYLGEYGIPGRHFFRKGSPPTHHVHWVRKEADFWHKQMVYRDFLRAQPAEAAAYETLKKGLAQAHRHDRAAYTASKSAFILSQLERAWRWRKAPLVIFDLEATCWEGDYSPARMETIEIGAVRLDEEFRPLGEFSRLVRPLAEPELSGFCRSLTGISQEEAARAEPFPEVFPEFSRWAGPGPLRMASWSDYDIQQLQRDCSRHGLRYPALLESHIDLRYLFAKRRSMEPCSMTRALELLRLPPEGRPHRGLDDAKNIARIARPLLSQMRESP